MRIYGLAEIAKELGENVNTVRAWFFRGKLPAPTETLKGGHVWQGEEIESWIIDRIERRVIDGEGIDVSWKEPQNAASTRAAALDRVTESPKGWGATEDITDPCAECDCYTGHLPSCSSFEAGYHKK